MDCFVASAPRNDGGIIAGLDQAKPAHDSSEIMNAGMILRRIVRS
jgi:hypothetical protein